MLLIPAGHPPLKQQSNMASGAHRWAMCQLAHGGVAVPDISRSVPDTIHNASSPQSVTFEVSAIELQATGPSYTLTTARKLRDAGLSQINWLIGADQLNSLPRWHEPEALMDEVNFIVMARPGYDLNWSALPKYMQRLQANLVEAPHLDISATNIRQRVASGLAIDWLTPPAVVQYIREHGLYQQS